MSRLLTSGGEIRDNPTSDIGSPDGWSAGAVATTSELTNFRVGSGSAAISCPATAGSSSYRAWTFTAPALGATVYGRAYLRFSTLPASTVKVMAFTTAAGGALVSARLTAAGKLQLFNDATGTQIGSDTALTLDIDTFYRFQLRVLIDTGAVDQAELLVRPDDQQVADESVSGSALTVSDTHAGQLWAGFIDATASTMFVDDVAVNDSTGTDHNGLPNEGRVVVLTPLGVGINGIGSWTDCSGGTVGIWDGANKRPPVGLADHVTAGHTGANAHQIRVAVNTAQTVNLLLQTLAGAGVSWPIGYLPASPGSSAVAFGRTASGASADSQRAQSFRFGAGASIDTVKLMLFKNGSPTDNVVVEIQSDASGAPSGTVLASATIVGGSLPATFTTKTLRLDNTVVCDPGSLYWIVARRSGSIDTSNYYSWSKWGTGELYPEFQPMVWSGTAWIASGIQWNIADHAFSIAPLRGSWPPTYATQIACHGEAVTGVKGATFDATLGGGAALAQKTFNFGGDVGVAGTYQTNWRWTIGAGARPRPPQNTNPSVTIVKNSGSGTNACLICFVGVLVEFALPPVGWAQWSKTADSSLWWAKRTIGDTDFELADGSILTVSSGDWAIYPDPQVAAGADMPATTTSIADDTLRAGYTLV